jgi:hypothetical protein
VYLALWFDNRDEILIDAEFGEIYSAALDCP